MNNSGLVVFPWQKPDTVLFTVGYPLFIKNRRGAAETEEFSSFSARGFMPESGACPQI